VNLQPYAAIAAVLLFRHLRTSPNWTKGVLVAVFLVESALSTGTRVYLQARRVPLVLRDRRPMATAKLDVDPIHVSNYMLKLETNTEFISDRLGELNAPFTMITTAISMALLLTTATMPSSGDAG
jgi:acyl dehydratase